MMRNNDIETGNNDVQIGNNVLTIVAFSKFAYVLCQLQRGRAVVRRSLGFIPRLITGQSKKHCILHCVNK